MRVPTDHRRAPRPVRRRLLAAVTSLGGLLAAGSLALVATNAEAGQPATPPGWSLMFSDDFTGAAGTGVNTANWLYDLGTSYPGGAPNWGTGEIARHTSSTANVYHDGAGNLAIKPIRDSAGNWTSGRIETQRTDFQPPAGGKLRVEARIQMPNVTGAEAQGYWPAFWMLGTPFRGNYNNWPIVGEIDVMENVNGLNSVFGTLHCGVNPGGPCNETTGLGNTRTCPGASCQSAFHTFRVEWDRSVSPEQMRWYVDDIQYHTVNASQMDAATWSAATNHGYFLILNVAMGGSWPGAVTAATKSGVPMLVDYVAAYRSTGATPPSPTSTVRGTPSPTPSPTPSRTPTASPTAPGRDAFATHQAELYNGQAGTGVENTTDVGGGRNVGWIGNGDWLRYDALNFGSTGAAQFAARVASGVVNGGSGLVEVRLDSPTSPPVGSFAIGNTGGWQSWRTVPANIARVTGTHTVYLTFRSGQPNDFLNVNWFTFSRN